MGKFLIAAPILAALALASLNFMSAPEFVWAWKLAIVAGEFGHWLAMMPLFALAAALFLLRGAWRAVLAGLALAALAGLLRPAFSAARLAHETGHSAFSWARLFKRTAPPPAAVRTEVFARPDGQDLKLDLYRPAVAKDAAQPPRPCLVVIHGGGWDGGDRSQLAAWNPRWVAQGWTVAAISYRLAPGSIWPAQGEDVRAALAWLKAHARELEIDPTRFVLLGRSAGGQLATATAYGARDPAIRGVIALYAPHDMPFAWSISREDDTLNSLRLMRQYFGGPPDTPERRARYESASGHLLARKDAPPTLLLHGRLDTLAWHRHSERLAARLRELGAPVEHLELPWATHGFDFNPDGPGGQLAEAAIARFLREAGRPD
jgi:acetyl esterase/lipase